MQICACWCVRRTFPNSLLIREIIRNAEVCAMVGIKYFVEDIWKKASLGYLLIAVAVAVCIRWYFHIPPPSYSVTFMAVVVGFLALWPEIRGGAKRSFSIV